MLEVEKTNLILSVMHLKAASDLLKDHELSISTALLKLSKALMLKNDILSEDIQNSKKIAYDIAHDDRSE